MRFIKRLIIISRPVFWLPTVAVYSGGAVLSAAPWSWVTWLGLLFFTVPQGVIVYGVNDIADRESDASNARKGGAEGAVVTAREAMHITYAVIAMAVIFPLVFTVTRRYLLATAVTVIVLFSFTYSVQPIRLKSRPVLDSVANGVWVLTMFLAGFWAGREGLRPEFPAASALFSVLLCPTAVHALGTVVDYNVDKKAGDRTIAVALGQRNTLLICAAVFLLCFGIAGRYNLAIGSYLLVCTLLTVGASLRITKRGVHNIAWLIILLLPPAVVWAAVRIR